MTVSGVIPRYSQPQETNCVAAIRPVLRSLLLTHSLMTLLIPLFIALLYYSTPRLRRQPIFILNALVIIMAFSIGVLADIAGVHLILSPQEALSPMVWVSSGIIGILQSILVDLILLVRLISVYSPNRVGPRRFALISGLPILLKAVRFINATIFLWITVDLVKKSGMQALYAYFALPYLKIEWVAQVVDNTYVSIVFLRTIHGLGPTSRYFSGCSVVVQSTLSDRLRSLFHIALSNFVIPTIFSIVQLIIIFVVGGGLFVGDVIYVNGMLSVYGVVFASVWAGKENRRNLEEAKQFSNVENRDRKKRTNDTLLAGMSTGPTSFAVEAAGLETGLRREGSDRALEGPKQSFLDVVIESGPDIALASPAEREGQPALPMSRKPCGSTNLPSS